MFLLGCGSHPLGNYAIERNFKTFGTEGNWFLENILPDISHKLNKWGWSKNVLGGMFSKDDKLASLRGAVCGLGGAYLAHTSTLQQEVIMR